MDLKQGAHEDLFARVSSYLRQSFGDLAEARDDAPIYDICLGREGLSVGVFAVGENDAVVDIWRWVPSGLDLTPEVLRFLLVKSHELRFGSLGVDNENDIAYEYSMLGAGVTKDALARVIRLMSSTLDELIDELTMRFR